MSRPIFARPEVMAQLAGEPGRSSTVDDAELRGRQPRAVRSALAVLECVARLGAGTTAQQIAADLGLARATTYRLVQLLVEDEYLVRLADLRGFALGRRMEAFTTPAESVPRVPRAARAVLDELRGAVRAGVHLVLPGATGPRLLDEDADLPLADHDLALLAAAAAPPPAGALLAPDAPGHAAAGVFVVPMLDESGETVCWLCVTAATPRLDPAGDYVARARAAATALAQLLA